MSWLDSTLDRRIGGNLLRRPRRASLRRSAVRYAEHGWDVVPGAWLTGGRFTCGRPACPIVGCHPAFPDWESSATCDPAAVRSLWARRAHAVLLATGRSFDVLEVPATLGRQAISGLSPTVVGGPVAVEPGGRWMFLVRPGGGLAPSLAGRPDVVLHGPGSWVPAPPTRQPCGVVRWRVDPRAVGFHLADANLVQSLIAACLPPVDPRTTPPAPGPGPTAGPPAPGRNRGGNAAGHFARGGRARTRRPGHRVA